MAEIVRIFFGSGTDIDMNGSNVTETWNERREGGREGRRRRERERERERERDVQLMYKSNPLGPSMMDLLAHLATDGTNKSGLKLPAKQVHEERIVSLPVHFPGLLRHFRVRSSVTRYLEW